jgi:hypothetical protein
VWEDWEMADPPFLLFLLLPGMAQNNKDTTKKDQTPEEKTPKTGNPGDARQVAYGDARQVT